MKPLELAYKYMEFFYDENSIGSLRDLFVEDLKFQGPFHEFNSAEAYLEALRSDPPEDFDYKILEAFENENSACLVYQFTKSGVTTYMSQLFEVNNGKISRILLIFDTKAFK